MTEDKDQMEHLTSASLTPESLSTGLHGAIMNLPHNAEARLQQHSPAELFAYRLGHRDARHAAAELALRLDAINAELLEALKSAKALLVHLGCWDDAVVQEMDCAIAKAGA